MVEGEHPSGEIPEVSMEQIIELLPVNVVAYEWQLFLKRIANKQYLGETEIKNPSLSRELIEEGARVQMILHLCGYADGGIPIPKNPAQMYMKESEFETGMNTCKQELLDYLAGTGKIQNSHIAKKFLPEIRRMYAFHAPENELQEFKKDLDEAKKLLAENVRLYNNIQNSSNHEIEEEYDIVHRLSTMEYELSRIEDFSKEINFEVRKQYVHSYLYQLKRINKLLHVVNERIQ